MDKKNLNKIVSEALAIEAEEAKAAGTLGYMARALVQATMPHKNPGKVEVWGRRNGDFAMLMQPGYKIDKENKPYNVGLPYGTKPRLVMAFISSEAVKTQSPEIVLGHSLSDFMRQLDLAPTGGRWGTIPMLREQMKRLFSATVSFQYSGVPAEIEGGFRIARSSILFWDPKSPKQAALWESTVTLTQEFYKEIIEHPVPINMKALSALKGSSMELDIYCWLTYRMSYLKHSTEIPWGLLAAQFGSDYAEERDFKKNFLKRLHKVLGIYKAKVEQGKYGLILKPSKPHIPLLVKSIEPTQQTEKTEATGEKTAENTRKHYEKYKLNYVIEVINQLEETERHQLLSRFDDYLTRRNIHNIRVYVKNGEYTHSEKQHLYDFVNSQWHHLLASIKSFDEFAKTAVNKPVDY